jgi:hypothetical protein
MDRPPDVPPRPPEAIIDLSQPSSSKYASKIYQFFPGSVGPQPPRGSEASTLP